ncbi:MAG: carboxypeptidase regulatory-like domain-containing protein, partial [Gemmatimonadales bacterium]|nr:carboxypeptidase regulatory-like domain-containing protein [Gemmatimonadales bacterium]
MKTIRTALLGALLAAATALPTAATAQVRLAEVSGTAMDASGGVLPGVTVTANHVDTGQVRTTVTQAGGVFSFSALPLGRYEFRAELQGFNIALYRDVRLAIGEALRLDIRMTVAALEETVTVVGENPLVDVTKSDLGGRVDQVQVQELPLSGRNWMNLATLAPGVKSTATEGQPTAGLGGTNMSKVFVDGASVQNRSTVAVDLQISQEVIGEFEVLTNRFDASLGRAGTAFVNAATKSGTDNYSGSVFLYLRDDSLSARDFFTGTREPYQNRQVGGTFGGPLVRGRTHFFANYERQVEPKTLSANTGIAGLDAPVDGTDNRNIYFARMDHSLSTNHRVNVRFNRSDRL